MIILGINDGCHHNTAESILIDGSLVASVEQERMSRTKNDSSFPHEAIDEVLSIAGITENDVDMIAKANLSRWEQRPYMNKYYQYFYKSGKMPPLLVSYFGKSSLSVIEGFCIYVKNRRVF